MFMMSAFFCQRTWQKDSYLCFSFRFVTSLNLFFTMQYPSLLTKRIHIFYPCCWHCEFRVCFLSRPRPRFITSYKLSINPKRLHFQSRFRKPPFSRLEVSIGQKRIQNCNWIITCICRPPLFIKLYTTVNRPFIKMTGVNILL